MVAAVRAHGLEVVVVDDGSDAACAKVLDELAALHGAGMVLLRLDHNQGKGGAMMAGLRHALSLGYTHALQIDADGQHEAADIPALPRGLGRPPGCRGLRRSGVRRLRAQGPAVRALRDPRLGLDQHPVAGHRATPCAASASTRWRRW